MVKKWTGKTIFFPKIAPEYLNDSVQQSNGEKDYKILLYVDSTGCVSCKLKLFIWIANIEEMGSKVDFLFYFFPKHKAPFLEYLRNEGLNIPVYIDDADSLNKINKLPKKHSFQCFLLDKNNTVLAIGNPATNFKIWGLYKKIITGKPTERQVLTTVEAEQTEIVIKDLQTGKPSEAVFRLKNTGSNPLAIMRVESSCGCTVPEWEKQPVAAGKTTEIKVKITPEKREYFHKTVTVHCNTEGGRIVLNIKGSVEK
jgi:hypothetical protein